MSRWEAERRQDFIEDFLFDHGRINREDVEKYFSISASQASLDLQRYITSNKRVEYDGSLKAYRWKADGKNPKAVRGSTSERRGVWTLFV